MTDSVAIYGAWTIRSFNVDIRKDIVAAAAAQQMEVGAFVERVWRSYVADGSPVQVTPAPVPGVQPDTLAAIASLADAARTMATAAGLKPPTSLAKNLLALTSAQARTARGLKPRTKALPAPTP